MKYCFILFSALVGLLAAGFSVDAQKKKKEAAQKPAGDESAYYKIQSLPIPEGEVLEGGAIEILPGNRIAFGTRRGEIWIIDNAFTDDPKNAKFSRFAHGMHEILGLAYKDEWLYVTQRCDVTRIKDSKGKGRADTFEVVTDGWEINGDYHEYAFGSKFDKEGNLWVVLCLTGSFTSDARYPRASSATASRSDVTIARRKSPNVMSTGGQ